MNHWLILAAVLWFAASIIAFHRGVRVGIVDARLNPDDAWPIAWVMFAGFQFLAMLVPAGIAGLNHGNSVLAATLGSMFTSILLVVSQTRQAWSARNKKNRTTHFGD